MTTTIFEGVSKY